MRSRSRPARGEAGLPVQLFLRVHLQGLVPLLLLLDSGQVLLRTFLQYLLILTQGEEVSTSRRLGEFKVCWPQVQSWATAPRSPAVEDPSSPPGSPRCSPTQGFCTLTALPRTAPPCGSLPELPSSSRISGTGQPVTSPQSSGQPAPAPSPEPAAVPSGGRPTSLSAHPLGREIRSQGCTRQSQSAA